MVLKTASNVSREIWSKSRKAWRLTRSQLEYCSVVWTPHTSRNISKLERIQRRVLNFILKTNDDYEQRREKRNLLSLEQRPFLFDVLFLYKALNGYVNVDLST